MKVSIRAGRISEQIRAEISRVLRDETSDPRIGLLTITRVKVSPDLGQALVFWSPLDVNGETDVEQMAAGLLSATGFVRGQIAQSLDLRRVPALQFRYDPSIERGSRTLALLRSLDDKAADESRDEQDGEEA